MKGNGEEGGSGSGVMGCDGVGCVVVWWVIDGDR
jgi:hypothetical protein